MEIDPGTLVLAMVLDALSGRHPLYRIDSFYESKDIELLLGQPLDAEKLSDDNFGRVLDLLYAANTTHLFSKIAMNALGTFQVPTQHIHFDTTSVTVYGAYEPSDPNSPSTLKITKGYSKDHRPDLNQFLISLLCTGGNVPIFSKLEDGNASDKKVNNAVITDISQKLSRVGINPGATKFESVQVIMVRGQRLLGRRLSELQELYLAALGLTRLVFTEPVRSCASPGAHGS